MPKVYFVSAPEKFPEIIAEIHNAGDIKHAKTAFLDFLSRTKKINWGDRTSVKQKILVKRGDIGDISSTITLDYRQKESEVMEEIGKAIEAPTEEVKRVMTMDSGMNLKDKKMLPGYVGSVN